MVSVGDALIVSAVTHGAHQASSLTQRTPAQPSPAQQRHGVSKQVLISSVIPIMIRETRSGVHGKEGQDPLDSIVFMRRRIPGCIDTGNWKHHIKI